MKAGAAWLAEIQARINAMQQQLETLAKKK